MSRTMSIYLDLCRFLAALIVALDHISPSQITGGFLWQMAPYGSQAVAVFFVLSGFVISFVTAERERDLISYSASRCTRLYSAAVPAVLLVILFDAISIASGQAVVDHFLWDYPIWLMVPATLTFVNAAWGAHMHPGSSSPFWSLSIEVAYYVAFGATVFLRGWWRVIIPALALLVIGPLAIAMAPLWLLGAGLYRVCRMLPQSKWGRVAFAAGAAVWACYEVGVRAFGRIEIGFALRPSLVEDYFVAVCFAATILGVWTDPSIAERVLGRGRSAIRWLAGGTFTLYLLHLPAMLMIASLLGNARFTLPGRLTVLLGSVLLCLLAAELSERRKHLWRPMFERIFRVSAGKLGTVPSV